MYYFKKMTVSAYNSSTMKKQLLPETNTKLSKSTKRCNGIWNTDIFYLCGLTATKNIID